MYIEDQYSIPLERSSVWVALVDPTVLATCIPACQHIEQVNESQYLANVIVKFGLIKFKFDVDIALHDIKAPQSYNLSAKVIGGFADGASASGFVTLSEVAQTTENTDLKTTLISFQGELVAQSKLLALGEGLLLGTAKKWIQKFFNRFEAFLLESRK